MGCGDNLPEDDITSTINKLIDLEKSSRTSTNKQI